MKEPSDRNIAQFDEEDEIPVLNPNHDKIHIFEYVQEEPSFLKRMMQGIKNLSFPPPAFTNFLANVFAVILGIASLGLLLPLIFKLKDISYEIDQEKEAAQFYVDVERRIAAGTLTPPSDHPIELKSDTIGFNHINDYVIKDKIIWYRRQQGLTGTENKAGVWKPMYFDQGEAGLYPVEITVDGANLNVVDQNKDVHYRKVLLESRGRVYENPEQFQMDDPEIKPHLPASFAQTDDYVAVDITQKVDWPVAWYNFPLINRFINFFTGDRLKAQGHFVNSHRGRYNDNYTDANNNEHPTSVGVTTGYEMAPKGTELIKYDPWAPTWSKILYYFPETEKVSHVMKKHDASASCILALGHEINRETGEASLTVLTNLCDIDILGGNPMLKYSYQTELNEQNERPSNDVRILPDKVENEGWVKHTLPGDANTVFYNQPTIIQKRCGERLIRIGAQQDGVLGYFEKDLKPESAWAFKPYSLTETTTPLQRNFTSRENVGVIAGQEPPKSFRGLFNKAPVKVEHFGERAYHSTVKVDIEGKEYDCALHRRWGLKTFFGMKGDYYELVVPKETKLEGEAQRFFGNKRVIPVNVNIEKNENEESIRIVPS